jgi:FtsP/CotA-like multicopper oxidase with cupredoxin domain
VAGNVKPVDTGGLAWAGEQTRAARGQPAVIEGVDRLMVDQRHKVVARGLYLYVIPGVCAHWEGQTDPGDGTGLTVDDGVPLQNGLGDRTTVRDNDSGGVLVVEIHRPIHEA